MYLFRLSFRLGKARMMSTLPPSNIPIFTTISSYRKWRQQARDDHKSVGFVATMGALHDGHLSLVTRSLKANDLTVISIFVNPAQFSPHEDLSSYPRTIVQDLDKLNGLSLTVVENGLHRARTPSAVFLPTVSEMYPSGIVQDVQNQKGAFVEVKGYGHQMEGQSRPTFFRGVATIVTKLFNVIEPTHTYFGQKDIQQALLLKRMCSDLLLSHPEPQNLHIVPIARDPVDGLALSSRNLYLTPSERAVANTLYSALQSAREFWDAGLSKSESVMRAKELVDAKRKEVEGDVEMDLIYLELNDADTFELVGDEEKKSDWMGKPLILSGALMVGKTRLIDNIIVGDSPASRLGILSA